MSDASRCKCGHTKADHHGTIISGDGKRTLSRNACLADTTFISWGGGGERVGGDRCEAFNPHPFEWLRRWFRAVRLDRATKET